MGIIDMLIVLKMSPQGLRFLAQEEWLSRNCLTSDNLFAESRYLDCALFHSDIFSYSNCRIPCNSKTYQDSVATFQVERLTTPLSFPVKRWAFLRRGLLFQYSWEDIFAENWGKSKHGRYFSSCANTVGNFTCPSLHVTHNTFKRDHTKGRTPQAYCS